jgi:hypothetical protein
MNIRLLIDGVMRQTTVLIAQLSTAAGVRAPLAHVADEVFLSLSREIEAQGVARKVVADMFGLALRGYQRKTQRLSASATIQGKTLFEAVLEYVEQQGGATRQQLLSRFERDGERETIGVLTDLVQSGLIYCTGGGSTMLYGVTSEAERQRLTRTADATALSNMALGEIYRSPGITAMELAGALRVQQKELQGALSTLCEDGRVVRAESTGKLTASTFQIPVDATEGWESAVFDHFRAVATAIINKLALRAKVSSASEFVGGTTLRFELTQDHPLRDEVLGLLRLVRQLTDDVWLRTAEYNDRNPDRPGTRLGVSFYFGQNVDELDFLDEETPKT